jgi:hypothetical protein
MPTQQELIKQAAAETDLQIRNEIFIPAFVKSAVECGVPEPRTEQDVAYMLDGAGAMLQAKQALAFGPYPELAAALADSGDYQLVAAMAKRAADELDGLGAPAVQRLPGVMDAAVRLAEAVGQARPAARPAA